MPQTSVERSHEMLRVVNEHPALLYVWNDGQSRDRYVFGGSDPYPDVTAIGLPEAYAYCLENPPRAGHSPSPEMVRRLRASEHDQPPAQHRPADELDRARLRAIRDNHPFEDEVERADD